MLVKQAHNFEAAVWVVRSMKEMIERRTTDKIEFRENRKSEGLSNSNKKN